EHGEGRVFRPAHEDQKVMRKPICPTRCSGWPKSPANAVGCMNDASGAPVALNRRVVRGMKGFFAFRRLNTSAIASTRADPASWNPRLMRRFNCEYGARRLQFTVSHEPLCSNFAVPSAFKPVYRYAFAVLSFTLPSALKSIPSKVCVGSADWYRKIGATSTPNGASTMALSETRRPRAGGG